MSVIKHWLLIEASERSRSKDNSFSKCRTHPICLITTQLVYSQSSPRWWQMSSTELSNGTYSPIICSLMPSLGFMWTTQFQNSSQPWFKHRSISWIIEARQGCLPLSSRQQLTKCHTQEHWYNGSTCTKGKNTLTTPQGCAHISALLSLQPGTAPIVYLNIPMISPHWTNNG